MGPKEKWAASTLILIAQVSERLKGYFKLFPYYLSQTSHTHTHTHTHTPHHHALPKSYMQQVTGPWYTSTQIFLKTEVELSRHELAFSRRETKWRKYTWSFCPKTVPQSQASLVPRLISPFYQPQYLKAKIQCSAFQHLSYQSAVLMLNNSLSPLKGVRILILPPHLLPFAVTMFVFPHNEFESRQAGCRGTDASFTSDVLQRKH